MQIAADTWLEGSDSGRAADRQEVPALLVYSEAGKGHPVRWG